MPKDGFGREINYLRVSLTSQCNLRCVYCMPLRVLPDPQEQRLLDPEEIELVARAAVGIGFKKIRLTGGEPTLRRDLVEIVERLARIEGISDLSMTTNGVLLPGLAEPLKRAGLKRVNIHLDTTSEQKLPAIMRFGTRERIWAGIEGAVQAGLLPLKINAVVARGLNEQDTVELAALTLSHPWHVRFIELMPLGQGACAEVARERYLSNEETRARIEAALGLLTPLPRRDPSSDSRNFKLPGAAGVVGFISPVSNPFCDSCNRMRLTCDGRFHLCLLNQDEIDARAAIRARDLGALQRLLAQAVQSKPTGHRLATGRTNQEREMFQLGG